MLLLEGALVQYFLYAAIGLAAFWVGRVFGILQAFELLMLLCTGTLLPLDLYPALGAELLTALPFRFFAYAPVMALQTEVSWAWVARESAAGLGWGTACGLFTYWLWCRGTRRFTGQGV